MYLDNKKFQDALHELNEIKISIKNRQNNQRHLRNIVKHVIHLKEF